MSTHAEHPIGVGRYDYPTFLVTALGMVGVALVALGLLGADIRKLGVLLDIDLWSYCNGT